MPQLLAGAELVGAKAPTEVFYNIYIYILLTILDNEKVKETRAWACGTMEADSDSEKVKMMKQKHEATWTRNVVAFTIFSRTTLNTAYTMDHILILTI